MQGWRRFCHLSSGERSIFLEAAGGIAATWFGLRLLNFRQCKSILTRLLPTKIYAANDIRREVALSAEQISRLTMAAAQNLPLRTNCLEESLVLWWLLQRRGIAAELRIGARMESNRFEAHAWVELDGRPLNAPEDEHLLFVPFDGPLASRETK